MMLSCAKRIMQIMTMCACIFFVVKSSVPTLNELYIYQMYCMWSSGMQRSFYFIYNSYGISKRFSNGLQVWIVVHYLRNNIKFSKEKKQPTNRKKCICSVKLVCVCASLANTTKTYSPWVAFDYKWLQLYGCLFDCIFL